MANGGILSNLLKVDATHYTALFTPTAGIQITDAKVGVTAASFTDAAGNAGAAATSSNFAVDTKAPVVDTIAPTVSISISDTALKVGETATASFAFSEAPVGFALTDAVANGGTLSNLLKVDATHYTAKFTPTAGIQITDAKVNVTAASYTDAAGNPGAAAKSGNFAVDTKAPVVDTIAPTVSISISDTALKVGETATASFAFSEAPVGFALTDTVANGGTLSNLLKVDATHYTAKFTPTAGIQITDAKVNVTVASYTDAAGNPGAAAD